MNRRQTLERLPDGFWRLEAEVDDTNVLDGWIASWHRANIRLTEKHPVGEEARG